MKKTCCLVVVGLIAIIGGISGGEMILRKGDKFQESPVLPLRPVPTVIAKQSGMPELRSFPGYVKAARRVELALSVSGVLRELAADKGRRVHKGEVLARLDERDFQHALDSANAVYVETKSALERVGKLHARNIVSSADYEKTQADYDTAAAELQVRRKALNDTVLIAPFDGVIADRYVENYEHVREKTPLVSIYDLSKVEVVIQVPEPLIRDGGTQNWQNIQVAFDKERQDFYPAEIKEIRACPDSVTGTYEVSLTLPPPERFKLLPGMTATVCLAIKNKAGNGVVIPAAAVCSDGVGNAYVWIIAPEGGKPRKQSVIIGNRTGEMLEVLSGVNSGEHVAAAGTHSLNVNQLVRPMKPRKDGLEG
ncbi:MAG: efflux RND transporter periplasmic adaptor subunit [Victivallales bacterium]|nr:efflux RND transporter periplasmic adaptor subunit [Victivallales bacterium]